MIVVQDEYKRPGSTVARPSLYAPEITGSKFGRGLTNRFGQIRLKTPHTVNKEVGDLLG